MKIGYQYIPLLVAGIAGIVWGIPAAHRLKRPFDACAAFVVLCGVIAMTLGVLLIFIPGFFR